MSYVEHLVASPLVTCTWEQQIEAPHEQRVVPDACVDLIWSGERLTIAGPDTRARLVSLRARHPHRRRCACARAWPAPCSACRPPSSATHGADAADVLGDDAAEALLDALQAGGDPHAILLRAISARRARPPPTRSCAPRSTRSIVRARVSPRSPPSSG